MSSFVKSYKEATTGVKISNDDASSAPSPPPPPLPSEEVRSFSSFSRDTSVPPDVRPPEDPEVNFLPSSQVGVGALTPTPNFSKNLGPGLPSNEDAGLHAHGRGPSSAPPPPLGGLSPPPAPTTPRGVSPPPAPMVPPPSAPDLSAQAALEAAWAQVRERRGARDPILQGPPPTNPVPPSSSAPPPPCGHLAAPLDETVEDARTRLWATNTAGKRAMAALFDTKGAVVSHATVLLVLVGLLPVVLFAPDYGLWNKTPPATLPVFVETFKLLMPTMFNEILAISKLRGLACRMALRSTTARLFGYFGHRVPLLDTARPSRAKMRHFPSVECSGGVNYSEAL